MALTDKTKLVLDQVLGSTIASREISKATDDNTSVGSTAAADISALQSSVTGLLTSQDVWPHGATGARPVGAVVGQRYFDTDLGKPIWCVGGGNWVFADGTPA